MDGKKRKFSTVSNISDDIESGGGDEPYVFGRPQREIIIEDNFESVIDIRRHEKHQKKKWVYFSICSLCNFAAIMLILYSLAVTNEFTGRSDKPNYLAFGFGCAAFIPFLVWLRVIFCPGVQERMHRHGVMSRKRARNRLEKLRRDHFNGDDIAEKEDDDESLDAYGMKKDGSSGAKKGSGGSAGGDGGDRRSNNSFLAGVKGILDAAKGRDSINGNSSGGAGDRSDRKSVLDAANAKEKARQKQTPVIGGLRLNEVNRHDPKVVYQVIPYKSTAHTRVVPEVKDPWNADHLVALKPKDGGLLLPYYQTTIEEQQVAMGPVAGLSTKPTPGRKKLPPLNNSSGNYNSRSMRGEGTRKSVNFADNKRETRVSFKT